VTGNVSDAVVILPLYSPLAINRLFTFSELQPKVRREQTIFERAASLAEGKVKHYFQGIPGTRSGTWGRMWPIPHASMAGSCLTR